MKKHSVFIYTIIVFFSSKSISFASEIFTLPKNTAENIWWAPLGSAFIGAVSALITPLIKDVIIARWNEKRVKNDSQHEIFRNYAAPLTVSSEKLIWRFNEILVDNRHQFLLTATMPLVYNQYKRNSTLYRIASLLGWISAINLELSALPRGGSGFLTPTLQAIGRVQSVLADGPDVEMHRLEQLSSVWRLDINLLSMDQKKSLATKVEVKLYNLAGEKLKHNSEHLKKMDPEEKLTICRSMADFLCMELHRSKIEDDIVRETLSQAITAMSYREALIYRDWQDAIGEAMLQKDDESVRRFRIIGYEKFEEMLKDKSLWMTVFRDSINDINFETMDPNDFRAKQLQELAAAVSQVLISLSETKEKDLVNDSALKVANKIIKLSK
ncbi:hypothetical protein MSKU15_1983 [Komagataeibacter diospyri]|uniref:hypothetical protein n=1 Tax=Komagataeibacter diospyri TaxID=1932662 RepID=UPI00113E24E9|nr:hypothetical protein [Komagataeibacter diospyri]GCE90382.1 hypothetical protein MSKU15_1983 [Komagataeibacter diospyri]